MNITSLISTLTGQNIGQLNNTENTSQSGNITLTPNQQLMNEIKDMISGQTISGQVLNVNNNDVELLIGKLNVQARLSGNASLIAGQTLSFQIDKAGGNLQLRPLMTNIGNEEQASRALKEAGIEVTKETLDLVKNMMNEGLPIDKESLLDMNKNLINMQGASPESIVELTKLGLEVNENNVNILEQYKDMNHQLSMEMEQISRDFGESFESLLAENKSDSAIELLKGFINTLSFSDELLGDVNLQGDKVVEGQVTEGDLSAKLLENINENTIKADNNLPLMNESEQLESAVSNNSINSENNTTVIRDESVLVNNDSQETPVSDANDFLSQLKNLMNNAGDITSSKDISTSLKELGFSDEAIDTFNKNGYLDAKELLENINKAEQSPEYAQKLLNTLPKEAITESIKHLMEQNWHVEPKQVADKENMQRFYQKLLLETSTLNELTKNITGDKSAISQSMGNLQNNLDFMNQMNQMVSYMQLPLKFTDSEAHGDLYVYTNKRALAGKDGNVSAFLHLDMEHLGPTDVYVAMQNERVSTQFYLRDDEALDLVESHLDMLTKRLQEKGYNMSVTASIKEEDVKKTPIDHFKEAKGISANTNIISKLSFDVRA